MIAPQTLSKNQKQILLHRHRVDVDNIVRWRRRDRFKVMFLWIMPVLTVGLLLLDEASSASYYDRPVELVTWSLAAFLLVGNTVVFIAFWRAVRRNQRSDAPTSYYWHALFRDHIGLRSPAFVRWTHSIGSLAVFSAAMMTERPVLAATWLAAVAAGGVRNHWEERLVRRELNAIDPESLDQTRAA